MAPLDTDGFTAHVCILARGGPFVKILFAWLVVYAFVGTQMAWSMRPFFGAPGEPFVLMRQDGGTFYESVVTAIVWLARTLLGWR